MKRKFKNRRGESFIETIAAMLIICLGMLMLAGSIVTTARVNKRASSETIRVVPPLNTDSYETDTGWYVAVCEDYESTDDDDTNKLPITLYKAKPEGGGDSEKQVLYYYEVTP